METPAADATAHETVSELAWGPSGSLQTGTFGDGPKSPPDVAGVRGAPVRVQKTRSRSIQLVRASSR